MDGGRKSVERDVEFSDSGAVVESHDVGRMMVRRGDIMRM